MPAKRHLRPWNVAICLAIGIAAFPAIATAEQPSPASHNHTATELTLNHGKKWVTDATLRQGMQHIRTVMQAAVRDIHARKFSATRYNDIASRIAAELGLIVANCKLDPQADAQLHRIITSMSHGTEVMEGKMNGTSRQAGAARVLQALDDYAKYFDHPGWKSVDH